MADFQDLIDFESTEARQSGKRTPPSAYPHQTKSCSHEDLRSFFTSFLVGFGLL